jgi:hypothetical protein
MENVSQQQHTAVAIADNHGNTDTMSRRNDPNPPIL